MVKPVVLISIPFCARAALAACKALGMLAKSATTHKRRFCLEGGTLL